MESKIKITILCVILFIFTLAFVNANNFSNDGTSSNILFNVSTQINLSNDDVKQLYITLNQAAPYPNITVSKLSSLPLDMPIPLDEIVLILNFTHDSNLDGLFTSASFVVKVPNINETYIVRRYADNIWTSVPFEVISEDLDFIRINVTATGLSYFVFLKEAIQAPVGIQIPLSTNETLTEIVNDNLSDEEKYVSDINNSKFDFNSIDLSKYSKLIVGAIMLVVILLIVFILIRKTKKSQALSSFAGKVPSKSNKELLAAHQSWVLEGMNNGYSVEQMRQILIDRGWTSAQCDELFSSVDTERD